MIGYLFPGQGMEAPAMGLSLAEAHPEARALLEQACELTGEDLPRLLRRGGPPLERTEVLQPCLIAVALGALEALTAEGIQAELVAGHSLGELAACAATGAITPREALHLARARGALMAREAARYPGGMLAVRERETALRLLAEHGLELAAHNAPDEWVLCGALAPLRRAASATPSARRLPVSGAWHGRAMAGAVAELEARVRELRPGATRARALCNATAELVDGAALLSLLPAQLTRPVRWAETMARLAAAGVSELVTVGPGRVLRGLVRKNLGATIRVHAVEDAEDLARTVESLRP